MRTKIFMGVSISKCQLQCNVPILGVIVSTFDFYLVFLKMLMKCNANILILGAMRNANEMQMKCK